MSDVRLIDANALIKKFEDDGLGDYSLLESVFAAGVYAGIENAPTIDAVPVVHARWEYVNCGGVKKPGFWRCTACKHEPPGGMMRADRYCAYCGAKIDEKEVSD